MYKVFIVEDEHLIRDSLRNQLLSLAETHPLIFSGEASDGEMALASIMDVKPDILLTDIRMPFMDGLSLAKEVRKIFPGSASSSSAASMTSNTRAPPSKSRRMPIC